MSQRAPSVPKKMREQYDAIVAITDRVCEAGLTEEYAQICRELAAKMSRKRASPLLSGKLENWAGAILYTIARVNFAFDKDATPHVTPQELCDLAGVKQRTASLKTTQIMRMFKIYELEPEWTLPSLMDQNPNAWFISVNGVIIDARSAPKEIQEEAFRLGLIPYVPG